MGMYKGLGRGLDGPGCECYVFSHATGAAPPVVTCSAPTTFWHSARDCGPYGLRMAWFAAENKLRDVFYRFEYYIFHIYAAAVMKPDPEAGVNMDSFPRMSLEIEYRKPRTQMGRAAVQVTR